MPSAAFRPRRALAESGAQIDRGTHGIRILVDAANKRQTIEGLWNAGCDVLRVNPLKDSLEEVFLSVVQRRGGAS